MELINAITLPSAGSYINAKTGEIGPLLENGLPDYGSDTTNVLDIDEGGEFSASLSREENSVVLDIFMQHLGSN
tara:strand:+ start:157 stop:378 length:222 start_codon:yes stop_codon:yes gene_type:complete